MMQRWGADAIRFMRDASEFGSYYKELTSYLLPHLPKNGHICDAGCGLGYLAQELAKSCAQVTALDASEAAIQAMRHRAKEENLSIRCENIFEIQDRFDAMVFCYFGKTEEILSLSARICADKVIVVKRDCSEHTFSIGHVHRSRHSVETLAQALKTMNIPYENQHIALELGQPFVSVSDALEFYRLYNKSEEKIDEQTVKERLVSIDDVKYSWYLPSVRKMELVVFSAKDLRAALVK